jgi:uncharacterized protein (DUF2062 family)
LLEKFIGKVRAYYYQLILGRENPTRIAKGIAIGVFTSFSPLIGIHTLLCIGFALIFRASKSAAILGSLICNPVTFPFMLFADYEVGILTCKIFNMNYTHYFLSDFKDLHLLEQGLEIFVPMLIGSVLIGAVAAAIGYIFSKYYFTKIFNEEKYIS